MLPLRALLPSLALSACTSVARPAPALEQRVTSADGVAIAYEQRGVAGPGVPWLVFVHGWSCEREFWRGTMDALAAEGHAVAALDLAGHGDSGSDRERWTLAAHADDVVSVVAALPDGDVILVGHSMGAPVALLAAPRLAPRVLGVVGVDSLHSPGFEYPEGFLDAAVASLEADFPAAIEASVRSALPASTDAELVRWIVARCVRTDPAAAIGLLRGLGDFRVGAALAGAGVPVRVINAAPGPGKLPTDTEASALLADFDAVLLEDVGHFPMLEQPGRFMAALRGWIEALAR
jgi:sigma-B regulation protein RsbQ